MGLSLVYVLAYVLPIFTFPLGGSSFRQLCKSVEYAVWVVFIADYLVQIYLASNRKTFLRREWFSLVIVAFPFFRPVRAIRAIVLMRQAATHPRGAALLSIPWVMGIMGVQMLVIMAAAELNVERFAPGANIHTSGDALWWALVTMTTIGYGDRYPVTGEGRLIAAALIIFGIGLVASCTGYFASWLLRQSQVPEETTNKP